MIDIKTNSKKIKNGDTFLALKGISTDGHGFILDAIKNGASKIIAEHGNYEIETIIVNDTRKYLLDYLKKNYNCYLDKMIFIGVTGTNGKTTTSFLIYQMLNNLGFKCSYIGTIGYYKEEKICDLVNTSPEISELYELLFDSYESGYHYVVMEVSSQGLAHHRFDGIKFDIALFTNLTQDHLDYHINMTNYAYTKRELFNKLKNSGTAIINFDDKYKNYFMLKENNNVTYGFNSHDYKIKDFSSSYSNLEFRFTKNINHNVQSSLIGKHNVYNLMAMITCLHQLGISMKKIVSNIPTLYSPPGRMDKILYKNNLIIIDYAHTPDAIENVYNTINNFTTGKIYTVFGCTGNRDKIKRPIMTQSVLENSTLGIITSDDLHDENFDMIKNDMLNSNTYSNYIVEKNRKDAIKKGFNFLDNNDVLLILGKGHEEFMITNNTKIPFSDKKIILNLIENAREKSFI